jgi:hypothetical protein
MAISAVSIGCAVGMPDAGMMAAALPIPIPSTPRHWEPRTAVAHGSRNAQSEAEAIWLYSHMDCLDASLLGNEISRV